MRHLVQPSVGRPALTLSRQQHAVPEPLSPGDRAVLLCAACVRGYAASSLQQALRLDTKKPPSNQFYAPVVYYSRAAAYDSFRAFRDLAGDACARIRHPGLLTLLRQAEPRAALAVLQIAPAPSEQSGAATRPGHAESSPSFVCHRMLIHLQSLTVPGPACLQQLASWQGQLPNRCHARPRIVDGAHSSRSPDHPAILRPGSASSNLAVQGPNRYRGGCSRLRRAPAALVVRDMRCP